MTQPPAKSFDRNFWFNVADGAFVSAGLALCSLQVFLPSWLLQLGASPAVIGLLPVVWFTGFAIPQGLSAEYVKPLPYRKAFLLKWGLFIRLPWLMLAGAAWWFRDHSFTLIVLTFLIAAVSVAGIGISNPVWLAVAVACSGGAVVGGLIAIPNLILELSPHGAEASYPAVASQIFAVGSALGPLMGGIIAERFGHPAMFWVAGGFGGWAVWRTRKFFAVTT